MMFGVDTTLVTFFIIVCSFYWYFFLYSNYWRCRNVPFKWPLPFFGNMISIIWGHSGTYMAKLCNEFEGPYFGLFSIDAPFLVVKDPDLIKRITIKDFNYFPNRTFFCDDRYDPVAANFLTIIKNPMWKSLRTKVSPGFSTAKMKKAVPLFSECAHNLRTYLTTNVGSSIDTMGLASKYTINVITSFAFGLDINPFAKENSEFSENVQKLQPPTLVRSIQNFSYIFGHKLIKPFGFHYHNVEASHWFYKIFNDTIKNRKASGIIRDDLLDTIIEMEKLELQGGGECELSANRLLGLAVMFFFAGSGTSTSAITFALYELAMHQDIQERLRNEIRENVKDFREVTYECVLSMKYLHMVISETLRKYPLTPFMHRECVKDYLIPETGLVIEKGLSVLIPQNGLHWNPEYFPEPQQYNPERFSDENKNNINPYYYHPFGIGPRNCIGERIALLTIKLGLISIIGNFKVETNAAIISPLVLSRTFLLQPKSIVSLTYTKVESDDV